jgi:hypothetical protein
MRYYRVERGGVPRPHVIRESPILVSDTEEDDFHTREEMLAHPALKAALDRWEAKDDSAYAHDTALMLLKQTFHSLGDAAIVGDEERQLLKEHAEDSAACRLMLDLEERVEEMLLEASGSGATEIDFRQCDVPDPASEIARHSAFEARRATTNA